MKKLFFLCGLLPLLTGCIPTDSVSGATAGGTVLYDKRKLKTMNQDRHATERGQFLINHSQKLKGRSHISVATFNHILLMVGQAQTPELREYANTLIAENVKNVQKIYNEVTIAGSPSYIERANDGWLTTKVKTAMLGTKHLHATEMKVVTEDGTVYLMGLVSRKQGDLAAYVARRVPGVKKVVKVFQYT